MNKISTEQLHEAIVKSGILEFLGESERLISPALSVGTATDGSNTIHVCFIHQEPWLRISYAETVRRSLDEVIQEHGLISIPNSTRIGFLYGRLAVEVVCTEANLVEDGQHEEEQDSDHHFITDGSDNALHGVADHLRQCVTEGNGGW